MVDYLDGVDIAVPDGATAAMSTVDNDLRDLKNRLLNSFNLQHALTGEHQISRGTTAQRPTGGITDEIHINTTTGMLEYYDGAAWQDAITLSTSPIPAATKMWFYNNAAPSGWTFVSSLNDRVLSVTSTEADGGATTGTWTISGLTQGTTGSGGAHTHVHDAVFMGLVAGLGAFYDYPTEQSAGAHTHT
ncbi:hypothetical protein LCGC14_2095980, partial [marine sediment metagenome]